VPGNDSALPTAHYTVGPEGSRIKNKGESGPERVRTAQNTHSGRSEKDSLSRDDPPSPGVSRRIPPTLQPSEGPLLCESPSMHA
jgi:hypothetical protein